MSRQLTNEEFGDRIGVGVSMASRLRSGDRMPGTTVMRVISAEFGLSMDELMAAKEAAERGSRGQWVRLLHEATDVKVIAKAG